MSVSQRQPIMTGLSFILFVVVMQLGIGLTWAIGQEKPDSQTKSAPQKTSVDSSSATEKSVDLIPGLAPLKRYLGNWEINAKWSSGASLWARNEFKAIIGGKFVEVKTFAKDDGGQKYHRYTTIYSWDAERKMIIANGFAVDGKVTQIEIQLERREDDPTALKSSWQLDADSTIRQVVWMNSSKEYQWQVWAKRKGDAKFSEIMLETWKKAK